jgi:hypothetical protein
MVGALGPVHISIITVIEFRAKQATGSRYMLADKSYAIYFFIGIDLDWLVHVKKIFL